MEIEIGARSDIGMVRHNNEDCFAIDLSIKLLLVCDGMGGHAAGEVASKMAVDVIKDHCWRASRTPDLPILGTYQRSASPNANRLASGIRLANQAIRDAAARRSSLTGMGSTVVAAQVKGNVLSIAHVGDSRLYLFRDQILRQLTRDHSLAMEAARRGFANAEEARASEMGHTLVRALGADTHVEVDLLEMPAKEGDQILICSDGLTDMVPDAAIAKVLGEAATAQHACDRVIEIANRNGGRDNVTVIVARLHPGPIGRLWNKLAKLISG